MLSFFRYFFCIDHKEFEIRWYWYISNDCANESGMMTQKDASTSLNTGWMTVNDSK